MRKWHVVGTFFGSLVVALGLPASASAQISRIEITRVESPTFEGASFGDVGQYEKLVGRAFGEVDPADRRNGLVTDISLAPRNANSLVEYSMDVYILRPIGRSRGNHRVLFEISNRGTPFSLRRFNDSATGGTDPTSAADAGNGFLMRQGYTILLSGWDATVAPGGRRYTITVPIARNLDSSSIVGPALEEFVVDNTSTVTEPLTYPAATLDTSQASLTVREHYTDTPIAIPAENWAYVNDRSIRLLPAGTPFQQGRVYEFAYRAKDPTVAGLGFAATRDLVVFLRKSGKDDADHALAGNAKLFLAFGESQSARFMHDFLYLGFNEDAYKHPVFDGMMNYLGGASGGFFNYRFAQPTRNALQHSGRRYPGRQFPFADRTTFDPATGDMDGRLGRCRETHTCPKIFEVNSANEYWVKAGSLLHTDTAGNDLGDPDEVRLYLLSSRTHVIASGPGICQQPRNPLLPDPALRALFVALDDWVSGGDQPPKSRVPRREDGTLVESSQEVVGFPQVPGVTYTGLTGTGDLFEFGPQFGQGILTTLPPVLLGSPYPVFVPKTDLDGNDLAGIRLPEIAVPLATYTGWGLRAAAFAGEDLCDNFGQQIDLAQTRAERVVVGDPRVSIEERYPNHETYVNEVRHAATQLRAHRLLLDEDVERYIQAAEASAVGKQ